jgi:hypothetical protein
VRARQPCPATHRELPTPSHRSLRAALPPLVAATASPQQRGGGARCRRTSLAPVGRAGVFSEGITHSGCAVLPFFPGAFEGGSPVQPVVVRYPFTHYNAHAFLTSLVNHFGRLFIVRASEVDARVLLRRDRWRCTCALGACERVCASVRTASAGRRSHAPVRVACSAQTPWMFIEVEYLPTVHPSADEASSGQLMADRVRAAIGAASGLPLHPLGARDLRKEMKKAEELAKAAKAAEAARKAGKQIDAPLL